jgi:hypothetical protein
MHCLLKFDIATRVVDDTDNRILEIIRDLLDDYQAIPEGDGESRKKAWRKIVASLPSGFCLTATMTTNYQQLKTMYRQRKNHKLSEWHDFCDWCDGLPHFIDFTQKVN